jgi:hypothetical protein
MIHLFALKSFISKQTLFFSLVYWLLSFISPTLVLASVGLLKDPEAFMDQIQQEVKKIRPWPIIIFNKQEIERRFLIFSAWGESDAHLFKRLEIISAYIVERGGPVLSEMDLRQLETFTTTLKDGAYAYPLLKSQYPTRYKLCAVFPPARDTNTRLEYERLLSLHNQQIYPEHIYWQPSESIAGEKLWFFSFMHEVGHCLDETFMPQVYEYEEPHQVHLSEAFAETFAALWWKQNVQDQTLLLRADIRTLYSLRVGQYHAQHPELGFGNPFFVASGSIYHLSPSLKKVHDLPSLPSAPLLTLTSRAQSLVPEVTLPFRSFTAVTRYLAEGQKLVEEYALKAQDSPEFFRQAYEDVKKYAELIPAEATSILNNGYIPQGNDLEVEKVATSPKEFCHLSKPQKSEVFVKLKTMGRQELKNHDLPGSHQISDVRSLQQQLINLSESLQQVCESQKNNGQSFRSKKSELCSRDPSRFSVYQLSCFQSLSNK